MEKIGLAWKILSPFRRALLGARIFISIIVVLTAIIGLAGVVDMQLANNIAIPALGVVMLLAGIEYIGKNKVLVGINFAVALFILSVSVFVFTSNANMITARYLTDEHYRYSPIVYEGEIYFPSTFMDENIAYIDKLGMLGEQNEGLMNDILFTSGAIEGGLVGDEILCIRTVDDVQMSYVRSDYLTSREHIYSILEQYNDLVLCSEIDGTEVRSEFNKEELLEWVSEYGNVECVITDYQTADQVQYIYVDSPSYTSNNRTFDDPIIYLGTILVKDGVRYYGSYSHEIMDE